MSSLRIITATDLELDAMSKNPDYTAFYLAEIAIEQRMRAVTAWKYDVNQHASDEGEGFCGITQEAVEAFIAQARQARLSIGNEYLSGPVVMRSEAGWYIGEICIERGDFDEYYPLPWDRKTHYMENLEDAICVYKAFCGSDGYDAAAYLI